MTEDEVNIIPSNFPVTKEKPVEKVKPPTMWPCLMCEKQTRSHRFPDGVVLCHGCYETMDEKTLEEFQMKHKKERFV